MLLAGNGQRDIQDQPLWASRIEEAALVLAGGLDVALHPALVVWFSLENGTIWGRGIGKETSGNMSIHPMPTCPPRIIHPPAD